MTANTTLSDFLNQYPAHTRQTYERALRTFTTWYQGTFGEPPEWHLITPVEVRDYMAYLQSVKRMSAASVNLHLAAIRAYLRHNGRTIHVRGPRQTKPPVHALSARDLGRLLAAAEDNPRDYAILSLMARAGLRVSEVIALEVSDLDLRERSGWVTIRQGKGNKTRKVPLGLEGPQSPPRLAQRPPAITKSALVYVKNRRTPHRPRRPAPRRRVRPPR